MSGINPRLEAGFTFIELVIAASIVSLVMLSLSTSVLYLFKANRSSISKTSYDSIRHSYFKKIRLGVNTILLENVDPNTSLHFTFPESKNIKAHTIKNSKWKPVDPDMMVFFDSGVSSRLKVNNWTFLRHTDVLSTISTVSDQLEVIFSRCRPYEALLSDITKSSLKEIYETQIYPVEILGEVKCCSFSISPGVTAASSRCKKLSEGFTPTSYSFTIKKVAMGYELIQFNKFLNNHDMNSVYALGFNGNFFVDSSNGIPNLTKLHYYAYRNLCETSSDPSASCKEIKNFTSDTLIHNLSKKEFYENIKLYSTSWPINVYKTRLDSANALAF